MPEPRWLLAGALALAACRPAPSTSPEATASFEEHRAPEATPKPDEPGPGVDDSSTNDGSPRWWTPLPYLTHDRMTDEERAASDRCAEEYRVRALNVTPAELLAGGSCFAEARDMGLAIQVHELLLRRFPTADEAPVAMRNVGQLYERLDRFNKALEKYDRYLERYPARSDAQATGKRAVCLARHLDVYEWVDDLLLTLQKNYGRKGYTAPSEDELEQLCAGIPTFG